MVLFAGGSSRTTVALFRFGSLDEVAAGRLENLAAPLASANDQLALVTWFQRAAPAGGVRDRRGPLVRLRRGRRLRRRVPAQIQSDYTFTAMVGAFGWTAAWSLTIGCALWLHALIRSHGLATRGEPRFVRVGRPHRRTTIRRS